MKKASKQDVKTARKTIQSKERKLKKLEKKATSARKKNEAIIESAKKAVRKIKSLRRF